MKRTTKIQWLPCSRSQRKSLHELDKKKVSWVNDLLRYMMRDVAKPRYLEINGKKQEYIGP